MRSDAFPQDWIPLSSQTPEWDKRVLLGSPSLKPVIGHLESITITKDSITYEFIDRGSPVSFDPTHWMPLPDTDCLLWE